MRFGVLYELGLPRPWAAGDEHRLVHAALEQIALADRVGFDHVWQGEHHFLEEHAHASAASVLLAAASQRTQRIRLGLASLPLAPAIEHPARVAEAVATLDLLSGGRVDLGTRELTAGAEVAGFGVDRATAREQWSESLDAVARMMVEEPFAGMDGTFVTMPPRNVVPKPRQTPHPPLWLACSRRETIRVAAEKGIGALVLAPVEPEEAREWVAEHEAVVASSRCVPAGFAVNPRVAVVLPMMLHPDEAIAIERGIDGAHFHGYAHAHHHQFGEHRPGCTSIADEFRTRRGAVGFARDGTGPRGAIGTPEQARELVLRYEAAGVDQVVFRVQAGRVRHEHVLESLRLFGEHVIPEFAPRAAACDAAKEERLAPAIAAALERRPAPRVADPGYVIAPFDTGPPRGPACVPAPAPTLRARIGEAVGARGEAAFAAFVRRADDRRLERTVGSDPGLRVLFGAMAQRYVPGSAGGFAGELLYELRRADGTLRPWTVEVDGRRARVRASATDAPRLTLRMSVADFVRLASGELDATQGVFTGRMGIEGDLDLAPHVGEMFGQAAAL